MNKLEYLKIFYNLYFMYEYHRNIYFSFNNEIMIK